MRSNVAPSAPTMIESVPFAAASRVRATGASANAMPRAANRAASSRASATGAVLRSTTHAPALSTGRISAPTAATSAPPGSERKTISDSRASAVTDGAARTPLAREAPPALGIAVERRDGLTAFRREIAAHRLAHDAEADEPELPGH